MTYSQVHTEKSGTVSIHRGHTATGGAARLWVRSEAAARNKRRNRKGKDPGPLRPGEEETGGFIPSWPFDTKLNC